jgi:hypothetical protein
MNKTFFVLVMVYVLGVTAPIIASQERRGMEMEEEPPWNLSKPMKKLWLRSKRDVQGWQEYNKSKKLSDEEQEELCRLEEREELCHLDDKGFLPFQEYVEKKNLDPNSMKNDWSFLGSLCFEYINYASQFEEIKYLLGKGADPNKKFRHYYLHPEILISPLEFVCGMSYSGADEVSRRIEVATLLLQHYEIEVPPLAVELSEDDECTCDRDNYKLCLLVKKAFWQKKQQAAVTALRRKAKCYQDCSIRCLYRDKQEMESDNSLQKDE